MSLSAGEFALPPTSFWGMVSRVVQVIAPIYERFSDAVDWVVSETEEAAEFVADGYADLQRRIEASAREAPEVDTAGISFFAGCNGDHSQDDSYIPPTVQQPSPPVPAQPQLLQPRIRFVRGADPCANEEPHISGILLFDERFQMWQQVCEPDNPVLRRSLVWQVGVTYVCHNIIYTCEEDGENLICPSALIGSADRTREGHPEQTEEINRFLTFLIPFVDEESNRVAEVLWVGGVRNAQTNLCEDFPRSNSSLTPGERMIEVLDHFTVSYTGTDAPGWCVSFWQTAHEAGSNSATSVGYANSLLLAVDSSAGTPLTASNQLQLNQADTLIQGVINALVPRGLDRARFQELVSQGQRDDDAIRQAEANLHGMLISTELDHYERAYAILAFELSSRLVSIRRRGAVTRPIPPLPDAGADTDTNPVRRRCEAADLSYNDRLECDRQVSEHRYPTLDVCYQVHCPHN